jgi:hypothetical protein
VVAILVRCVGHVTRTMPRPAGGEVIQIEDLDSGHLTPSVARRRGRLITGSVDRNPGEDSCRAEGTSHQTSA